MVTQVRRSGVGSHVWSMGVAVSTGLPTHDHFFLMQGRIHRGVVYRAVLLPGATAAEHAWVRGRTLWATRELAPDGTPYLRPDRSHAFFFTRREAERHLEHRVRAIVASERAAKRTQDMVIADLLARLGWLQTSLGLSLIGSAFCNGIYGS